METDELNWKEEEAEVRRIEVEILSAERALKAGREELSTAESVLSAAQDAQEILQHLAQAVQQKAHERISKVVTSCLAAVFDDPYDFKITFDQKRGKTEASLRFVRRGLEVEPLRAAGGGTVDVAAFALRVACLMLHRPRLSRVLVLDEPFRFVSAQYQDKVRAMLEGLAKDMGLQMVMVTHNEALATGKVIEL